MAPRAMVKGLGAQVFFCSVRLVRGKGLRWSRQILRVNTDGASDVKNKDLVLTAIGPSLRTVR